MQELQIKNRKTRSHAQSQFPSYPAHFGRFICKGNALLLATAQPSLLWLSLLWGVQIEISMKGSVGAIDAENECSLPQVDSSLKKWHSHVTRKACCKIDALFSTARNRLTTSGVHCLGKKAERFKCTWKIKCLHSPYLPNHPHQFN